MAKISWIAGLSAFLLATAGNAHAQEFRFEIDGQVQAIYGSGASLTELLRAAISMRRNERLTRTQTLMAANSPIFIQRASPCSPRNGFGTSVSDPLDA